jgi:hypothetical protein
MTSAELDNLARIGKLKREPTSTIAAAQRLLAVIETLPPPGASSG